MIVIPQFGRGYWEKAAFFSSKFGSLSKGVRLVPSTHARGCLVSAGHNGGTGRPASSVSVGKMSMSSTSALVRFPPSVTPGTFSMKGTRVPSSKLVILVQ